MHNEWVDEVVALAAKKEFGYSVTVYLTTDDQQKHLHVSYSEKGERHIKKFIKELSFNEGQKVFYCITEKPHLFSTAAMVKLSVTAGDIEIKNIDKKGEPFDCEWLADETVKKGVEAPSQEGALSELLAGFKRKSEEEGSQKSGEEGKSETDSLFEELLAGLDKPGAPAPKQEEQKEERPVESPLTAMLRKYRNKGEGQEETIEALAGKDGTALDAIRALTGGEEVKALAEEIERIAPHFVRTNTQSAFLERVYLLAADGGVGSSTYVALLATLAKQKGLLQKDRVVECKLKMLTSHYDEDDFDKDMVTYLSSSENCALVLDISDYIDQLSSAMIIRQLKKIDQQDTRLVFLRVPLLEEQTLDRIAMQISDVLTVQRITVVPPKAEEMLDWIEKRLKEVGFTLDEPARKAVMQRFAVEKSDGRFYGFTTCARLTREIIFEKHKCNALAGTEDTLIVYDDLRAFAKDVTSEEKSGEQMLAELVGMQKVKDRIEEILTQLDYCKDGVLNKPALHMRFVGNPGTGKTTVARILGRILMEKGYLRTGGFFEHQARDLVGMYVGHTAVRTAEICRDAYGSVLFLDEAYTLYAEDNDRDFGKEALATLISEMENHRSDFVVIMAGYTDEMQRLMKGNPGLESRMPFIVEFPNYSREELASIFFSFVEHGFNKIENPISDELRQAVTAYFNSLTDSYLSAKDFSNARFVRNLFERTCSKAATRRRFSGESEFRLLPEDFDKAIAEAEFSDLKARRTGRIGF
ncbi:MAG: AAA family ATPase [Clostridia bacterium]|nr:AAA family ATPase [Clostridia bacterium]